MTRTSVLAVTALVALSSSCLLSTDASAGRPPAFHAPAAAPRMNTFRPAPSLNRAQLQSNPNFKARSSFSATRFSNPGNPSSVAKSHVSPCGRNLCNTNVGSLNPNLQMNRKPGGVSQVGVISNGKAGGLSQGVGIGKVAQGPMPNGPGVSKGPNGPGTGGVNGNNNGNNNTGGVNGNGNGNNGNCNGAGNCN